MIQGIFSSSSLSNSAGPVSSSQNFFFPFTTRHRASRNRSLFPIEKESPDSSSIFPVPPPAKNEKTARCTGSRRAEEENPLNEEGRYEWSTLESSQTEFSRPFTPELTRVFVVVQGGTSAGGGEEEPVTLD